MISWGRDRAQGLVRDLEVKWFICPPGILELSGRGKGQQCLPIVGRPAAYHNGWCHGLRINSDIPSPLAGGLCASLLTW